MISRLRFPAFLLAATLSAVEAFAGDIASIRSLGFSSDGKVFGYEEFGVQDGSGFPYAAIYAIDVEKDTFLPGTPYRARLEEPGATVAKARFRARMAADSLITTLELTNHPADYLAFNPLTEVDTEPHKLRYRSISVLPPVSGPNTLVLEESFREPPENCRGVVEKVASFSLRFTERDGKPANDLVYSEERIPASRNCVKGYRLGGVVSGRPEDDKPVQIALVLALSAGFEGEDGRWIAIPLTSEQPVKR